MLVGLLALVGVTPTVARAQLSFQVQRCQNDALPADLAAQRLEWMRRCALQENVHTPGVGYGIGVSAANGTGELIEYAESDSSNFWGLNSYTGTSDGFEVNSAYVGKLYYPGATSQVFDPVGFALWERPASLKKPRPLYPIYGSGIDISSSSNTQLFPHPTLADCKLYPNKSGTSAVTSFYVNAFCEAASITALADGTSQSSLAPGTLSDAQGATRYYSLSVPAGAGRLSFSVTGGTGDVDLYVKFGRSPTLGDYDCRPLLTGNTESCVFDNPSAGTWYVMLHARSAYSGVTLLGQYPLINVDIAGCSTNMAINNAIAQSFRVSAARTLDSVELWMKPNLYYTTSYVVELYDGEGTSGTKLATSSTLTQGSQTGGVPSTWYSFSFRGQGLVLQPNRAYTLKLVRLSTYSGAFAQCGNVYPNGIQYWLGYSPDYSYDVAFRLYTTL
jgi:hypothetical protein